MPQQSFVIIGHDELISLLTNKLIAPEVREIVEKGVFSLKLSESYPLRMLRKFLHELLEKLAKLESADPDTLAEITESINQLKEAIENVETGIHEIEIGADPQAINEDFTTYLLRSLAVRGLLPRDFLVSSLDELPLEVRIVVRGAIAEFQQIPY